MIDRKKKLVASYIIYREVVVFLSYPIFRSPCQVTVSFVTRQSSRGAFTTFPVKERRPSQPRLKTCLRLKMQTFCKGLEIWNLKENHCCSVPQRPISPIQLTVSQTRSRGQPSHWFTAILRIKEHS